METSSIPQGRGGVYISTYGCQMNVNDTERMYSLLEMMNYTPVQSAEEASLIIINSCSVREKPVHKVHSEVGTYKKLKSRRPHLKIGVAGCVGQQEKGQLFKDVPLIDFVIGPDAIDKLPAVLEDLYDSEERQLSASFDHKSGYHIQTMVRNPGVSTFVNITKGCDNFCTFCVVPFTRGRERSRPLQHLVEDINALVQRGVKEVTLVGQNVNSYKSECGADFGKLLDTVASDTDILRIRYTTPHPKDFNRELMEVMEKHKEKVCEYLHLPVQSGNTEVLKRMNRGYSRDEYLQKVKMIQEVFPAVVFSTDIIVGFPGETEEQFQDTLTLLDEVPYETLYAFKYSPRPFTKAAQFKDEVPQDIASRRLTELLEKHRVISFELAKKYEGQVVDVLVEEPSRGEDSMTGRSTHNKRVHFTGGDSSMIGRVVPVKIETAYPATLHGVVFE